jgi:hypothetical protein
VTFLELIGVDRDPATEDAAIEDFGGYSNHWFISSDTISVVSPQFYPELTLVRLKCGRELLVQEKASAIFEMLSRSATLALLTPAEGGGVTYLEPKDL